MIARYCAAACLMAALSGCVTILTPKPVQAGSAKREFHVPQAKHVVLIVLENKDADAALGQPFLRHIADTGVYFTNYYGVAHPSQPNYVAMVSGSTEGVRGDSATRLGRLHLGRRLDSWTSYAERYPSGTCDLRTTIGRYARKHEPFLSFADVQDDKQYCSQHVTGFEGFISAAKTNKLPQFSLVIPDLDDDAHDKPLAYADAWLSRNFSDLIADPDFRRDVLLIITFDEDGTKLPLLHRRPNRVYTAFWGDSVIPGSVPDAYNHYDLLRTLEAIFNVEPMAAEDSRATVIGGTWR